MAEAQTLAKKSGIFTWDHSDPKPGSGDEPTIEYVLTDDQGQATELVFDKEVTEPFGGPLSLNGKRITVQGTEETRTSSDEEMSSLGDKTKKIKVNKLRPEKSGEEAGLEAGEDITGSQPAVTILCRFSDSTSVTPHSSSWFNTLVSGGSKPSIDHFWKEVSFNNINLTGSQVFGWYNLPQPKSYYINSLGNKDTTKLANDCTAAADSAVTFPSYTTINLMFNQDLDNAATGGYRPLTLDGQTKTYGVTWMPPWGYENVGVLGHEMGHSYGLPHSSGDYGQTYDSWWDVMSSGGYGNPCNQDATYGCMAMGTISAHKDRLNWIPSSRKYTANSGAGQNLTIERLGSSASGNYLMAQIPIGGSSTRFYTVEARRFVGYDSYTKGEGIVIHRVDTTNATGLTPIAKVVDTDNNGNPNDAGAMWLPGETFTDAANGISVQVTGATTTGYGLTISASGPTPPANDNFASAQSLTGPSATVNGSNNAATKETGEPDHADDSGGKSVWYKWTPQNSGTATIDTAGSSFDTLLGVYTGSAVSGLSMVANNDDANGTRQSEVSFQAAGGTTYRIAVDGYSGAAGNITLNLDAPGTDQSDTTDPTATINEPEDGATYQVDEEVLADYECEDETGGSGIDSCEAYDSSDNFVDIGDPIDTSAPGSYDLTVYAYDVAGNETSTTHSYDVEEVAGTQTFQEDDRDFADYGKWSYYADANFSDGGPTTPLTKNGYSAITSTAKDSATFKFKGTSIAWITSKLPDAGKTDVYLDNVKFATFDAYSATSKYDVAGFFRNGLTNTAHTLKLVNTGTKNPASTDTYTEIDRFVVNGTQNRTTKKVNGGTSYQENHLNVAFGPWTGGKNTSASGGTFRQGKTQSAYFYGFTGPYVDLVTAKGPTRGSAKITIYDAQSDAFVKEVTANLNATAVQWQHEVRVDGLDPSTEYYLTVTPVAKKPVVVDAYEAFPFEGAQQTAAETAEKGGDKLAGTNKPKGDKPGD